ncbi:MAG: hypothetical protein UW94_C0013G0008 [Parcubacteria group bacterium GW2011_GWA2_45_14]|nr:MAG: hypothetical protein UW94_C0013G0008 [Parcubacteria group bacterium GW2011_GWA2_45_14]
MYKTLGTPKVIDSDDQRRITIFEVIMEGEGRDVLDITNQRLEDTSCRQKPCLPLQSQKHQLKVTYALGEGFFVSIQTVQVSFDGGRHWSVFYDPKNNRVGNTHPLPRITFYFLSDGQCDDILNCILNFKDKEALRELIRHPEVFPEIDDEEEELPNPIVNQKF